MAQAKTQIEVEADPVVIEGKTDDRGRINLGSEYGDQEIVVAVIESENSG